MNLFRPASIVAFITVFLSLAADAVACPTIFKQINDALWAEARASKDPAKWVQYFVTAQCPEYKADAQALFKPIFGLDASGAETAASVILISGKFTGDQTQTWEKAKNGQLLEPHTSGADLYTFQITSLTKVPNIPVNLYPNNTPPPNPAEKDAALWVRYRCHVFGHDWTGYFGDPGTANTGCNAGDQSFDRIEYQLMGPYTLFFDFELVCRSTQGTFACPSHPVPIRGVTPKLSLRSPYSRSFLEMLTNGYVR